MAVSGVLLLACGGAPAVVTDDANAGEPAERAMLLKVNEVRAAHGLRPLREAPRLERSAGRYARWILRADRFEHQSRIQASSRFRRLGENLSLHGGHRPRVRYTVRAWMHSPGHRALLLSRGFRWLGAGKAAGRYGGRSATTWVLHLGG
jgi:uncharacterized protein YkwD